MELPEQAREIINKFANIHSCDNIVSVDYKRFGFLIEAREINTLVTYDNIVPDYMLLLGVIEGCHSTVWALQPINPEVVK